MNIEVPELLPSSRGYDVDAHALLALAAVQAVCREAAATASVLTHTLDCALRMQLLLRDTVLEGRVSVHCAAWGAQAEEAAPPGRPLLVVGPDGEAEPDSMRATRQQAAAGGGTLVLLNHRPASSTTARFGRPRFLGGGRRPWSPSAGVELAYEIVPLVLRRESVPGESLARVLLRRSYPNPWVLMVSRRDSDGYIEVARRETRPTPRAIQQLSEASAGLTPSPAPAKAAAAAAAARAANAGVDTSDMATTVSAAGGARVSVRVRVRVS